MPFLNFFHLKDAQTEVKYDKSTVMRSGNIFMMCKIMDSCSTWCKYLKLLKTSVQLPSPKQTKSPNRHQLSERLHNLTIIFRTQNNCTSKCIWESHRKKSCFLIKNQNCFMLSLYTDVFITEPSKLRCCDPWLQCLQPSKGVMFCLIESVFTQEGTPAK